MRILVVIASKHQATAEVGDVIVEELRAAGHQARRVTPGEVRSLDGVDAVVLGSAVYMTQWMESMRDLVARRAAELRARPLWAFSVGLAGVPAGEVQDPARAAGVVRQLDPLGYVTFKGRLDPSALGLRERSVARMGSAAEGDYREWDKIRAWARGIAAELAEHAGDGQPASAEPAPDGAAPDGDAAAAGDAEPAAAGRDPGAAPAPSAGG
ncbi:flavodoxin domain-containing protein [Georgenia sp. TF02-10]|uniref:flavodoxin domain-containing protein n=1 Tax=Georgenia sp. TF02-10 TaxID=2917725 RepID=UPI001FA7CDC0|nr:flavodoxin domain-containing protein [Georgenia sp. TF02-10]UNX56022.1 flavodoxin domain-containing protein [Georgenia sp. TF02-10]